MKEYLTPEEKSEVLKNSWNSLTDDAEIRFRIQGVDPMLFKEDNHVLNPLQYLRKYRVLDFGCGIGRNIPLLLNDKHLEVYGYDFENMIEGAKRYLGQKKFEQVKWIKPPLDNIKGKFDLIIAFLVLQHLTEKEVKEILDKFISILNEDGMLYVYGRWYLEDYKTIYGILS